MAYNSLTRLCPRAMIQYFNYGVIVWSILAIELIIYWNSISDVYDISSTGQVIPLSVGFGSLIKNLYSLFFQRANDSPVSILPVFKAFR